MRTLFLAMVIIASGVLGATLVYPAHGQPVYRWRYDHTGITHSGEPVLDAVVARALTDWGQWSAIHDGGPGMDITVEYGPPPGWTQMGASALAAPYGGRFDLQTIEQPSPTIPACTIYVAPDIIITDFQQFEHLIMHEVGHCLGLDHIDGMPNDCIMGGAIAVCNDDRDGIHTLYPPPSTYKLHLQMITLDK